MSNRISKPYKQTHDQYDYYSDTIKGNTKYLMHKNSYIHTSLHPNAKINFEKYERINRKLIYIPYICLSK